MEPQTKKSAIQGLVFIFLVGLFFGGVKTWLNTETVYVFSQEIPTPYDESLFDPAEQKKQLQSRKAQNPEETLSVRRDKTEKELIIDYITEVFKEEANNAFKILECENRNLDPYAVNYNRNGTRDLGIFQLNDAYWGGEENFDWKTNIDKAYYIQQTFGWYKWSCSWKIGVKPYYER